MNRKLTFFTLLLSSLSFFSLKPTNNTLGIELELLYNDGFGLSLTGIYKTEYVEGKISANSSKAFPENIAVKIVPNKSTEQQAAAILIAGFADGSLNSGIYYLQKTWPHYDEELENSLATSFFEKNRKNKAAIKAAILESKGLFHD